MAWPKLRSHKSPGQAETVGDHSGAAPDGAQSYPAPPAASPPAPSPADESPADESPADADADFGESSDVPFWSWGKTEDPAEPDDVADSPVPAGAAAARAWTAAGNGAAGSRAVADGAAANGAAGGVPRQASRPVVTPVEPPEGEQPRIGQRRGNLAHLSADPRKRAWQWRAIFAIIVGVLFTILVSWQLGLTLAVLAAIADTIYRSRRGLPGRSRKMTRAQRQTRSQLAKLGRAGYRAMHGNVIPQSEEQIDHLVVGPAGVFAIDSEHWDKRLAVRTKNARQLWHGPFSMKERLEHARWESQRAAEMLSGAVGSPVTVRPAMAVYGPRIPWDVVTIRDVDVFSGPRLRKYLRRMARQDGSRALTAAEVERIYSAANQAFPHLNVSVTASRIPAG
jgi:hypothetical protein